MSIYQPGVSGNIGALLRLIEEEKSSNPAMTLPSSESGSPIRGLVQQPLKSPESVGTTRMVSQRPEAVTQSGPEVSPVVAPVMPPPPVPTPVPTPTPPSGGGGNQPSYQASQQGQPSMPSLGTKLVSSLVGKVLGTSASKPTYTSIPSPLLKFSNTPMRPSIGGSLISPMGPTPTPSQDEAKRMKNGQIPKNTGGFYRNDQWNMA